jgi:hypothetical protein
MFLFCIGERGLVWLLMFYYRVREKWVMEGTCVLSDLCVSENQRGGGGVYVVPVYIRFM